MAKSKRKEDSFDSFNEDDFKDDFSEEIISRDPSRMDGGTFYQRNNPEPLLKAFKLKLLNAYEVEEEREDKDGDLFIKKVIKPIPGTKPKANKQGVEDIMRYLESIVNNHTVQANLDSKDDFNNEMRHISQDVVVHFVANRTDWGISIRDCDILISNAVNLIDLFLTRALYNKEREGYSEGYKEITTNSSSRDRKPNTIQRMADWFSKR